MTAMVGSELLCSFWDFHVQTKMLLDKIGQTYSLLERCAKSANVFLVVCETGKGLLEIFLNGKGAVHIRHSK